MSFIHYGGVCVVATGTHTPSCSIKLVGQVPAVKGEDEDEDVVDTQELPCNINPFGQLPDDVIVEPVPAVKGEDEDEDVVDTQELPCNINPFGQLPDDVIVEPVPAVKGEDEDVVDTQELPCNINPFGQVEDGKDDDEVDVPNCCCVKFWF
jgi:hypothetical protein